MSDKNDDLIPAAKTNADDLLLLQSRPHKRIFATERQGKTVWIKRQGIEKTPWGKRLHTLLSPLLPSPFMRASPHRKPHEMNEQEIRKIKAFHQADIPAPHIIAAQGVNLMIGDVGETLQKTLNALKKTDPQKHDALLVACAYALGKAHHAGLVHGRPHPRDMFMDGDKIGFFDFEEEPEAVMPLATAQARDAWLLFFQISAQARDKIRTPDLAFQAWAEQVDNQTMQDLRKIVRFFSVFIKPLRLLKRIYLGADGQRMLSAMEFLDLHLNKQAEK